MFLWELLLATITEYPNNGGLNCKVDEYFQNQNIWRKASSDMVSQSLTSEYRFASLPTPQSSVWWLLIFMIVTFKCLRGMLQFQAEIERALFCAFSFRQEVKSFPGPPSYPIRGRSELGHMDMSSCRGTWESKYLLPRFCNGVSKT